MPSKSNRCSDVIADFILLDMFEAVVTASTSGGKRTPSRRMNMSAEGGLEVVVTVEISDSEIVSADVSVDVIVSVIAEGELL